MGMDVLQATIHKHYGRQGDTRLDGVLRGSMGEYLTPSEKKGIIRWVELGATAEEFKAIKPIFDKNCIKCHSPASGLNIVPLTNYAEVKNVTNIDIGESIKAMARISHVHLFGLSFIFLSTGIIFSLSNMNKYPKLIVILIPFLAIWLDIGSWWVAKYKPFFAYAVIGGGALMGIAFAVQIIFSLYEMWFERR